MASGATAKAWSAVERRLIDNVLRTTNDHPRKKRKRGTDQLLRDATWLDAELFQHYIPRSFQNSRPDSTLVRVVSRWIRDPLCRRVVSSLLGSKSIRGTFQSEVDASPSPSTASASTPPASPPAIRSFPSIKKRFPSAEDKDFVDYEALKSYVGEMSFSKSSKVLLVDGDRVEIVHKSLGDAFEIRISAKAEEAPSEESFEGEAACSSFELISESLNHYEEAVYPPPLQHPSLGPFHLKIPAPLPPPPTVPPEVVCGQCTDEESICFSCEESDVASACEWRSDSTSQVELSFATDSLIEDGSGKVSKEAATEWMVESFKRRLEVNRHSSSSSGDDINFKLPIEGKESKNPFCAVPLRVLGRGKSLEASVTLRDDICRLAYVEELISLKTQETLQGGGGWFRRKDPLSEWNPFLCEGKVVSLSVDDGLSGVGKVESSKGRDSSDFLVTPRFDMTLEEHLQQSSDCSVENRLLLFLQSLEAVAGLHTQNLAHGSVAASNFFLDLQENGRHRMLLSDFSKTGNLTEDRQKVDSWQLGRLGLRLFDNDVDDEGSAYLSAEDFSVDDLPALSADAPLEMDILVHLLMSNDANQRISPSIAANMLHLYFWRNDLRSAISETTQNVSPTAVGVSSQEFQTAKVRLGAGVENANDVKMDLRRSLFRRASFDDILHADEMWKKSRVDLAKYSLTGDERHAELFVESRS